MGVSPHIRNYTSSLTVYSAYSSPSSPSSSPSLTSHSSAPPIPRYAELLSPLSYIFPLFALCRLWEFPHTPLGMFFPETRGLGHGNFRVREMTDSKILVRRRKGGGQTGLDHPWESTTTFQEAPTETRT